MVPTPTVERQESQPQPTVGVFFQPDLWLKVVRELGSFGLIAFLVVFWVMNIQPSISEMQKNQVQQIQAMQALTDSVKELGERLKEK